MVILVDCVFKNLGGISLRWNKTFKLNVISTLIDILWNWICVECIYFIIFVIYVLTK